MLTTDPVTTAYSLSLPTSLSAAPSSTISESAIDSSHNVKVPLPIGYCHNAPTEKIEEAIENGVNVIVWSFIHMDVDNSNTSTKQNPIIRTDLPMEQIKQIKAKYKNKNLIHMAAFGGWNGPHPPINENISGIEWCRAFMKFNQRHENVFDGIDWDLEGHDDREAPTSRFTIEVLDIMAEFSIEAKKTYGLLVSLAPAESYLDPLLHLQYEKDQMIHSENTKEDNEYETNTFSLRLNLFPPVWDQRVLDRQYIKDTGFSHAGKQCYAYVLHRAGVDTFDWICK